MARTRNKTLLLAVVVSLLLPASPVISSIQQRDIDTITKEELLAALRKKALTSRELISEVQQYGVAFQLTPAIEEEIRSLGKYLGTKGLDDLVVAVRHKYRVVDVALCFVYPKAPVLVIVNQSDSIVRNIKWAVVLWNIDLPDRNDPLPIPVTTFDFIRPHDESGPQNLFDGPLVAPLLKPGNRLMGSASLDCPDCARGRTYFIYIVWGGGGWVSEIESEKSGKLILPPSFLKETRDQYFQTIEATVPEKSRIPISESVQKSPLSTPIPASAKPTSTPPPMQAPEQPDFPVAKINWVSEPVSSPREDFPFAVRVTIQSAAPISPVHFVIECSSSIAPAKEQPLPSGISFGVETKTRGGTYEFRMENPPLTPQQPVILVVLSAMRFKVLSVKRLVE